MLINACYLVHFALSSIFLTHTLANITIQVPNGTHNIAIGFPSRLLLLLLLLLLRLTTPPDR